MEQLIIVSMFGKTKSLVNITLYRSVDFRKYNNNLLSGGISAEDINRLMQVNFYGKMICEFDKDHLEYHSQVDWKDFSEIIHHAENLGHEMPVNGNNMDVIPFEINLQPRRSTMTPAPDPTPAQKEKGVKTPLKALYKKQGDWLYLLVCCTAVQLICTLLPGNLAAEMVKVGKVVILFLVLMFVYWTNRCFHRVVSILSALEGSDQAKLPVPGATITSKMGWEGEITEVKDTQYTFTVKRSDDGQEYYLHGEDFTLTPKK